METDNNSPLRILLLSEKEEQAYHAGREMEARLHKCPPPLSRRPYPTAIMSSLDTIADAAYEAMGMKAYEGVNRLNTWLTPEDTE